MFALPITTPRASRMAVAVAATLFPFAHALASNAAPVPQITPLDTVEVEADAPDLMRLRARQASTPGAVSLIDGHALQLRSINNLADALRNVPGVTIRSKSGGGEAYISIRGSNLDATDYDNNGVLLLRDGLPTTAADGNNHNRFIDPFVARYISVARGANALAWGASTLGGAINTISRTARNSDPNRLYLHGGSHGLENIRLSAGGVHDRFDGIVMLGKKHWDGYREHSRQRRSSVHANVGWQATDDLELRLFTSWIDSDQALPGALTHAQVETDPDQANSDARRGNYQKNVRSRRVAAKGSWRISSESRLEFGLSWEKQTLYHPIVAPIMADFDGPGPLPPTEVFSLLINTDQTTFGGMLRYHLDVGNHGIVMGLNLSDTRDQGGQYRNRHGHRNGQTVRVDNHADNVTVFMLDHWRMAPDWTLVYGAQGVFTRRDLRQTDLASGQLRNPNGNFSAINPRLGVIHDLSPHSQFFANVSRLYEPPTNYQLKDDVAGGNHLLDAMSGTVVEIGLRGSTSHGDLTPRWHWQVAAYSARIHDEILSVEDPERPGTSLATNIERTLHAGIEASLGANFPFAGGAHRLEPRLSLTWNHFRFDSDPVYGNNTLPVAPENTLHGELIYRHASGFFAGMTVDRIGTRYADFSNHYRLDAYTLTGLRVGYEVDRWEWFIEARNLADKDYIAHVTARNLAGPSDAILYPGAPRSVYAGLRIHY